MIWFPYRNSIVQSAGVVDTSLAVYVNAYLDGMEVNL